MEDFYRQKGQDKEVTRKVWLVSGMVTFLWGTAGVSQANYLTGAEQVILG